MTYGSARDLPKLKEMQEGLQALRLLGFLLPEEKRADLRAMEDSLNHLTATVDAFYVLLGPRHWVFHDDLSVDDMAALVRDHPGDPDGAEAALIAWYQEPGRIQRMIRRLSWHEAWRARRLLLERTLVDYTEGRYYAVVQLLLSIMDGFVNDLDPASRKGLHARDADELDAWDSVVGHHDGLTAAHETFTKSFKRRSDEPTHELYRNGLVHGMLTNYDNDIIATKAWNRVFAVSDWARSLQTMAEEARKPPPPTLRESLDKYARSRELGKAVDRFVPVDLRPNHQEFTEHPAYRATQDFLEAWQHKRYGLMPPLISKRFGRPDSPGEVRQDYQDSALDAFNITRVAEESAAVCHTYVELFVGGKTHHPKLRWLYENEVGELAVSGFDRGQWRLIWWGSAWMLQDTQD